MCRPVPVTAIADDDVEMNASLCGLIDQPQGDGWLSLEGDVIGNASPTTLNVLAPFLGQTKLPVDVPGVVGVYIAGGDHHKLIFESITVENKGTRKSPG